MNKIKYLLSLNSLLFSLFAFSEQMPGNLDLPDGFEVSILTSGLDSPRQIAETDNGHLIVGSKTGSEVIALIKKIVKIMNK